MAAECSDGEDFSDVIGQVTVLVPREYRTQKWLLWRNGLGRCQSTNIYSTCCVPGSELSTQRSTHRPFALTQPLPQTG